MKSVSLDAIKTDRVLTDREGLEDLAANISEIGQSWPIVLLEDMTLVDGLRRIEAIRLNGGATVEAVVTDDLGKLQSALRKNHVAQPATYRRIYELHEQLAELIHAYHNQLRLQGKWQLRDRPPEALKIRTTEYVYQAVNLGYASFLGRVVRVYRAAIGGEPMATDLVKQVEAGEISMGRAAYYIEEKYRNIEELPPIEQRRTLVEAMRNLKVTIKTLRRLPANLRVPNDELQDAIDQLRFYRTELTGIQRTFTREVRRQK